MAARVLQRSFIDDPVLNWIFRHSAMPYAAIGGFFDIMVQSLIRRGHSYRTQSWEAVCLWSPPGMTTNTDEHNAEVLGAHIMEHVPPDWLSTIGELTGWMTANHCAEPHFYLAFVGADPDHQGRGYGASAMAPILALCDHNALPAYLESSNPRNIAFYERMGFAPCAEFRPADGPLMTTMLRPPCPG